MALHHYPEKETNSTEILYKKAKEAFNMARRLDEKKFTSEALPTKHSLSIEVPGEPRPETLLDTAKSELRLAISVHHQRAKELLEEVEEYCQNRENFIVSLHQELTIHSNYFAKETLVTPLTSTISTAPSERSTYAHTAFFKPPRISSPTPTSSIPSMPNNSIKQRA